MRPHEIEAWTLRAVDQLVNAGVAEDALVEFKATWPDAPAAARRIAGHCNAAGGAPVLWVVGVDEKARNVPGVAPVDMAAWWPAVTSHFNQVAPGVTPLNVFWQGTPMIALLFETDRAPFAVKNPVFGQAGGGPVELEVPWRDGTRVRSARREDLLRILVPASRVPRLDLVSAEVHARVEAEYGKLRLWQIEASVYAVPASAGPVVIPFHRCACAWWIPGSAPAPTVYETASVEIWGPAFASPGRGNESNVRVTGSEVCLDGPGLLRVLAHSYFEPPNALDDVRPAAARVDLYFADTDRAVSIEIALPKALGRSNDGTTLGRWTT